MIVHGFRRVQGLALRQGLQPKEAKEALDWRWAMRQEGAGSQRALQEWLQTQGESLTRLERTLEVNSERELAAAISRGDADVGPVPRAQPPSLASASCRCRRSASIW